MRGLAQGWSREATGDAMQPPAVVITQDSDSALLSVNSGLLGASTLSLARVHPTADLGSTFDVSTTRWHIPVEPKAEEEEVSGSHWCSARIRRAFGGTCLIVVVCCAWVGAIHLLKHAYLAPGNSGLSRPFRAPFLATWFFTACNCFFFPLYLCLRKREVQKSSNHLDEAWYRLFRGKGLSTLHLLTRCFLFCVLWVGTEYMFVYAVDRLDATAVMALQASSAAFIYLLFWVVLHEQFVGIRIVAVIMCNTGIALLAYMDGVSRTSTLGGVVLASASAAGLAVFRVLFKKLIGNINLCQLSLFLSLVGALNVLCLWPIGLTLYLIEAEVLLWTNLPYPQLSGAAALFIVANVLCNFDLIQSYDVFLKLGLLCAVPVSAVLDVHLYHITFKGMKLAGILLISSGFLLVLLPDNWPQYLTGLIRWRCPTTEAKSPSAEQENKTKPSTGKKTAR